VIAAVQEKACPKKVVMWNGTDSSGTGEHEMAEVGRRHCVVDIERQHG